MVDPSYKKYLNRNFGGAWTLPDVTQVPIGNAIQAQNVYYVLGAGKVTVGTRLGFSSVFTTIDHISAMYNWVSDVGNFLFWYRSSDNSVQYIDLAALPSPQVQIINGNLVGTAATFTPAGARLILSFFNSAGSGASGAQVLTSEGGTFVHDLAFQPPITYNPPAPTQTLGGVVTAGMHYFGYLIVYRSGFITRPSPDSGVGTSPSVNSFNPVSMIASGGTYLTWNLTTTWPIGAIAVIPIMTTVTDPAQWLVPQGLSQAVVGGSSSTVTFIINIQDQLLTATGQDMTPNLTLFTNSVANVPQFYPSSALTHGNRCVWVVKIPNGVGGLSSALLVSAIGSYQQIDFALSLIQLPGQRQITTCMSLDGVLYIFGPQWTYQTKDNQGDPVSWSTPDPVDGSRGSLSIRGVQVSPSGTYGWVAATDGLYYFQGVFPAVPISYYQDQIWSRINWSAPQAVQIKDIPHLHKIIVMACLDKDTVAKYMLTWDYTRGFTPELVNFSGPDFLQSCNIGAMEAVDNGVPGMVSAATQQQELWLGSSDGGGILRNNQLTDANLYFDNGFPVFSSYETALYPPEVVRSARGEVMHHHGADYRVTGTGVLQVQANTLDHVESSDLLPITLSTGPGLVEHRGLDLISEGVSHLFTQGHNLVVDPSFEGLLS